MADVCATRSRMQGMPNGRNLPGCFFGIRTCRTGFGVLHGATVEGKPVFRKMLSRGKFLAFLSEVPPCQIVMEACGGAHHWGRQIIALGHACKLIPADLCQTVSQAPEE